MHSSDHIWFLVTTLERILQLTLEQKIQNDIMVAVARHGCTVFRSNAGTVQTKFGTVIKLAPKGWPDITGFRHSDGKMILIEVKNETGKLREDQIKFQKFIKNKPVLYGVCRSVEDAIKLIEED